VCRLLVEGQADALIVTKILEAARLPFERLNIVVARGKEGARLITQHLDPQRVGRYAALPADTVVWRTAGGDS